MLRIVVSQGDEELGAGDYELDLVRIGSTEDNDLQVEDQAVSPHHVEVFLFGKCAYARSPDGMTLLVNGTPVEGSRAELDDGATITIEDYRFQVRIAPPEATSAASDKTYKSGRVKLRGSEMLGLPSREEEEQLILRARRVLVGRGATQGELDELRAKGAELAQEILEAVASGGLAEAAAGIRSGAPRIVVTTAPKRRGAFDKKRAAKVVGMLLAALGSGGLMAYKVAELFLSFTP